jgi:cysteinyl-tRNA synthetase
MAEVDVFDKEFLSALADDLNTARALAAFHVLLTKVNQALDGNGITADVRSGLDGALRRVERVLNILPAETSVGSDDAEIDALVAARQAARKSRDFARADAIRQELSARGIVVEDTPHGPVWRRTK